VFEHAKHVKNQNLKTTLILLINDINTTLNALAYVESPLDESLSTKWEAPTTFVRKTIKFWIDESRLVEVLMVLSTLRPILVYGRSGRLTENVFYGETPQSGILLDPVTEPISSVYFDSPNFRCYHSRLA
jgi:SPX domain protein involved in polyphosphate accumulation